MVASCLKLASIFSPNCCTSSEYNVDDDDVDDGDVVPFPFPYDGALICRPQVSIFSVLPFLCYQNKMFNVTGTFVADSEQLSSLCRNYYK